MSRAEHTYQAGDVVVQLVVPEGIVAPATIRLQRSSDGAVGTFTHMSVRAVRPPVKRKPRQVRSLEKITADWAPPEGAAAAMSAECPSVDVAFETAQFVDWAISKGEIRADWAAAWRRWVRTTHKRNLEKGWKPSPAVNETKLERWCREYGVTVEEYEQRKGEPGWLDRIKRRGKVA